jgi:hypothetical protein
VSLSILPTAIPISWKDRIVHFAPTSENGRSLGGCESLCRKLWRFLMVRKVTSGMRPATHALLLLTAMGGVCAQEPYELVRRSIAQDQLDWLRMKDYTWQGRSVQKHLDAHGKLQSTKRETWETLILDGDAYRRILERNGEPLSQEDQRNEQRKLDKETRRLSSEKPLDRARRLEESEKRRKHEFAFLSEIPELFDLRIEGNSAVDGRSVWVVSGAPKPGAKAKSGDAKVLLKVRGRIWIDKATYQWARLEAETTDTISWGVFLARLDSGSKMVFEQAEVSPELWFPKRLLLIGSGRVGLIKRLAREEEIEWSNYRKFSVDSKLVTDRPANLKE